MAKHKKAAGAAAVVHEEKRALERASEIRLREPDPKGDTELYDAGDPRDTEPAPPPTFEPNGSIWSDFDRELTMSTLRLEDALHDCTSERAGAHVLLVMADAEALADALFALWSQTRAARPAWAKAVSRVYRWACDVVDQLEEALVVGPDGEEEILSSFRLLASYSSLFVRGLIGPAMGSSINQADADADEAEVERLRAVRDRIELLDWTIACAAVTA